ncbi:MAG: sigma-70 family RNA polymerase sigma factor [Austwickia sp.]|nr:sigma-70 family RNA polymerase sigma factor [Austwickia sp.]
MNRTRQPAQRHGINPEARFRAFYSDSYADVLRFVRRRTPPDRAEDVVAEVFLVAWRRVADLPVDRDAARAWVYGVARHTMLNDRRATQRRDALAVRLAEATWPAEAPDPATDPQFVADRLDLEAAWRELPAADQEVLALTVLDGLTSAQAGAVLGITAVAYRLRLSRARATLRRALGAAPEAAPDGATTRRTAITTTELTS